MLRRNKALILVSCATLFFFMIIIRNVCHLQNEEYILTDISRGEKRVSQAVDARWQPVLNTSYDIWVYSAFLEDRKIGKKHYYEHLPTIRLIGRSAFHKHLRKIGVNYEIVCRFWYDEEDTSNVAKQEDVVDGNIEYIRENFRLKFSAAFIFCPLKDSKSIPTSVSIYARADVENLKMNNLLRASNRVLVNHKKEIKEPGASMAACVAPLHSQYSRAWQIIEWIEFNRLLGVSHFYLYDQSIAKNVTCVLKEYASRGIVTLLDWDGSPYKSTAKNNEIRAYNMFATLNDCLYRGMYKHKYLAFYDVDEYLMPKKHKDLIALMEDMERQDKNMASLTFRNTFFYTQWPDDPNANNSHLVTMRKTRRKVDFHRVNVRSKYICKPEEVLEVGNHFVWKTRTSQMKQKTLGLDVGFLHHYRSSCELEKTCLNLKSEIDTSMWKWKNELTEAVTSVQQSIGKKCELTPI